MLFPTKPPDHHFERLRPWVSARCPSRVPNGSALAALLVSVICTITASAADGPSVLVTTTQVKAGSLPHVVSAYGKVQADPAVRRAIMAPASASVARLPVRLGQAVAKGAPLIELVPNPQTGADYAKARAVLEAADQQLTHTKELFGEYLATKQQMVDAKRAQTEARATLYAIAAQGGGGPKTLTAPFAAIVTKIDASVGTLVTEGAPLLELAPPDSLVLKVGVVPSQAASIKPGDATVITPLGGDAMNGGEVLLRGAMVDPADGLVPVEISLPPNILFPGQSAEAQITTAPVSGFVVPHRAILINASGHTFVVQIVAKVAKLVPVRVLDGEGDKNVVAGPLDPKAPLVLSGAYQLQDGMQVRLATPKPSAP